MNYRAQLALFALLAACGSVTGGTAGYGFCPGETAPSSACRSNEQCIAGNACVPPVHGPICGIPCFPDTQCASDAACMTGQVCATYVSNCCTIAQPSTQCAAACTATSCATGERCRSDGHCEAIPCGPAPLGYSCPVDTTCQAGATGEDGHGCVRDSCVADADCTCGTCMYGLCEPGPGTCMAPVP